MNGMGCVKKFTGLSVCKKKCGFRTFYFSNSHFFGKRDSKNLRFFRKISGVFDGQSFMQNVAPVDKCFSWSMTFGTHTLDFLVFIKYIKL